ncbi:MAG: AAA family ATPase [Candidatus Riflebacteria bacterium]|nr:AAA family ATPase [Candidatus Riflebacteria bacterium]
MEELLYESHRSRVVRLSQPVGSYILKILNRAFPPPEELARFRQEYAMTSFLKEIPGVVRCRGLIRHLESLALELEDIDGVSLDRLTEASPLTLENFLLIAPRLTDIIVKIHDTGVIHRDINPSNVVWNSLSGELQLIDFGIADHLPEELVEARPPKMFEGTLAFMAPEQTGRTNRPVDARSDLYALGATFYVLLTGQPPFTSQDPLSLIADHLAKTPEPVCRLNPEVPEILSRIVLKLLAKEPDERYQSAIGLAADLQRCQTSHSLGEELSLFPLGQHERVVALRFSARLHGREEEIKILFDALKQVQEGGKRLLLLRGGPGTGKTALGRELRRSVSEVHGRFAGGKFDQLQRDRPMAAMMEALSDLLRQRQADPSSVFEVWQQRVPQEVGEALTILARQIPELAVLFPKTTFIGELAPAQAAVRYRLALVRLLCTLSDAGRPLVLFLDDLQWADLPFLDLLGEILWDSKIERLLIVGAYRDCEVPAFHPLAVAISGWEERGLPLTRLSLKPLTWAATLSFLADSLGHEPGKVALLAALMQERSAGNPFYLRTLLTECHERGWLYFGEEGWEWKSEVIREWRMPDSIIALLLERLSRMQESCLHLLATAACLGHAFDLDTLAAASGCTAKSVAEEADQLLNAGFWLPQRGERRLARWMEESHGAVSYRFVHDRVQEATLGLIPLRRRETFRAELGLRLLAAYPNFEVDNRLFLVAEQFLGLSPRLLNEKDRQRVARVLLAAGRRAKGAVAFTIALRNLEAGMALLGKGGWAQDFSLSLALRQEAAECAGGLQDLDRLLHLRREVEEHCADIKDRLPVLAALHMVYLSRLMVKEMRQLGIEILQYLGYPLKLTPGRVDRQLNETRKALVEVFGRYESKELASLPPTENHDYAFLSRWLLPIFMGLYFGIPSLLVHFTVSIGLRMPKEGLVKEAAWYFVWMCANLSISADENEFQCGLRLGEASRLILDDAAHIEQPDIPTIHFYNVFVRPWQETLDNCCSKLIDQYKLATASGDPVYAGWAITAYLLYLIELGRPLGGTLRIYESWRAVLETIGQMHLLIVLEDACLFPIRELQGVMDSNWRIREDLPPEMVGNREVFSFHLAHGGITAFLFRDFARALPMFQKAKNLFQESGGGRFSFALMVAYESLALIALLSECNPGERRRMLSTLSRSRKQLDIWAKNNPANFFHLERLVAAAFQRAMGHPAKALALCEEAVASIRAQKGEIWMQYEAMVLELAGECLLELRLNSIAGIMLRRSIRAWSRYGGVALVQDRVEHYGHLVEGWNRGTDDELSNVSPTNTSDRQSSTLLIDYPSLLQASQAIGLETTYKGVVERLLSLTLANAGAERARIFLPQKGEWVLACEGDYSSGEVALQGGRPQGTDKEEVLLTLVRYVARSREAVVLNDCQTDTQWSHLAIVPCSFLCTPLLHMGEVMGILLLEHANSKGVFTRERLETVAILGAQAAISLTNARIMEELQQRFRQIRRLGAHLDQVSEAEKRHLAGEVHDDLGNTLTAVKISLVALGKRQQNEVDRQLCQEISQMAADALLAVQRISYSLRPVVLDRMGLRVALENLVSSTRKHSGLDCQLIAEKKDWPLNEAQRIALFRIAQEALTNVMRHAKAKTIVVVLREESKFIVLEVRDDGCGIEVEEGRAVGSFGLVGMRERAERLGGRVSVTAIPTGGTCVTARISLATDRDAVPDDPNSREQ